MVAYRMMDGATVANSELMIFASDGGESEDGQYVDYVADGMAVEVPESIRDGVFIGTKYKHRPAPIIFISSLKSLSIFRKG